MLFRDYRPITHYADDGSVASGAFNLDSADVHVINIPKRARVAKITYGGNIRYTLDGSDPTADRGFPLTTSGTGVTDVKVGRNRDLRIIRVGGSDVAGFVQFLGGDYHVRALGTHRHLSLNNNDVHTLFDYDDLSNPAFVARRKATELLLIADQAWSYTVGSEDPTATVGIYVPADTYVALPCRDGIVKARRRTSTAGHLQAMAFEDRGNRGDEASKPVGFVSASLGATNEVIAVPYNARWARIGASTHFIRVDVMGNAATATQSILVAANTALDIPVTHANSINALRGASGAILNVAFFQ